jgi:hypothetical protein
MITLADIFAVGNQYILDAEDMGGKQIALQCHPVPITAVYMDDGLHSLLLHEDPTGQRAHPHDAVVHIGNDNGVDTSLDPAGIVDQSGYIDSFRGVHFSKYDKFSCGYSFSKTHMFFPPAQS